MLVISLIGQKGGVGKSTLIRVLASAIVANRRRALLLDCDPNQSTAKFMDRVKQFDAEGGMYLEAHRCENTSIVRDQIEKADNDGNFDYCLIDTQGDLVNWVDDVIGLSDLVLIPVKVSVTDVEAQLETYGRYLLLKDSVENPEALAPAKLVLNQVKAGGDPASKYPAALRELFYDLVEHPAMLKSYLPEQNVFNMIDQGVLLEQIALRLKAAKRPAGFAEAALEEAKALLAAAEGAVTNG